MTRTVGLVAAAVGGLGWLAKLAIMGAQGGPDPNSTAEAVAFFVGLGGVLVGSAAGAMYLARHRAWGWRAGAAVAGILVVATVVGVGQAALSALPGDGWVQQEAIFGVVGLIAVVVAAVGLVRSGRPASPMTSHA